MSALARRLMMAAGASDVNPSAIFVSTSGNDANNGSISSPVATLLGAYNLLATRTADLEEAVIVLEDGTHVANADFELWGNPNRRASFPRFETLMPTKIIARHPGQAKITWGRDGREISVFCCLTYGENCNLELIGCEIECDSGVTAPSYYVSLTSEFDRDGNTSFAVGNYVKFTNCKFTTKTVGETYNYGYFNATNYGTTPITVYFQNCHFFLATLPRYSNGSATRCGQFASKTSGSTPSSWATYPPSFSAMEAMPSGDTNTSTTLYGYTYSWNNQSNYDALWR